MFCEGNMSISPNNPNGEIGNLESPLKTFSLLQDGLQKLSTEHARLAAKPDLVGRCGELAD